MPVIRLFHWTCSLCSKEETKHDYGFPRGWICFYYKSQGTLESPNHACTECRTKLDPEKVEFRH